MKVPDPSLLATMSPEEIARTFRLEDRTIQELSKTIAQNPRSTIEPAGAASDTAGRRAIEGLGAERGVKGIAGGLSIESTIGEGGMGIVRIATQRSLGRKVAVKTTRPESRTEKATLHLLREAWVTGSLEHPNIVPVYDLGLDEDGSPIIVLKKIEGVEWATVIAKTELEQNLRILTQLCNAVSLAHARGILHRDLKPENVMIGSFGEVYLVDWGIAVSLADDPSGRLPGAKVAAKEIAGTPCYMAPEMLGMGELTERTDVYLLGAILHEILTGKAPHQGTFGQIVASIITGAQAYPDDVPKELVEIARKAMCVEAEGRFASADELRQRLEWYLRHRGSLALSAEAARSLGRMKELVVLGAARDEVYRLFAESRFAFRQAIAASADNEDARHGLRDAIETMVAYELERGTPDAAAAALAELETPPPSLALRVTSAREKDRAERERLAKLDADLDMSVGRRTRLAATAILGVSWIVSPQTGPWMERAFGNPSRVMYVWTGILTLISVAVGRWGQESLSKTAINRRARAAMLLTLAAQFLLEVSASLLGVSFVASNILHFVVWALCVGFFSVMVDPRIWPAAATYVVGLLVASTFPDQRWHVMTVCHTVLMANFVLAWGKYEEDRPKAIHERIKKIRDEHQASRRPPPNA